MNSTTNPLVAAVADASGEMLALEPRTNTIGETISAPDGHEDCPPVGSDFPAVFTMHCPSGDTNACVRHARAIETLFQRMWGMRVQATKAPEGSQCDNCVNEIARTTGANP